MRNRKGFILFVAVAMIPLAGVALLLLSGGARIMADEERLARREACRRDLFASGAAWVSLNRERLAAMRLGDVHTLDLSEWGLNYAACSVRLDGGSGNEMYVTIEVRVDEHARPRSAEYTFAVGHPVDIRPVQMPQDPNAPSTEAVLAPVNGLDEAAAPDPNSAPSETELAPVRALDEAAAPDPNAAPTEIVLAPVTNVDEAAASDPNAPDM